MPQLLFLVESCYQIAVDTSSDKTSRFVCMPLVEVVHAVLVTTAFEVLYRTGEMATHSKQFNKKELGKFMFD